MRFTERIISSSDSPNELSRFIIDNAGEMSRYFNATKNYLARDKEIWHDFVLTKKQKLRGLDFGNRYVRAFIVNLLELSCRFGFTSAVSVLMQLVDSNKIIINKRLEAEACIFYPKISHAAGMNERLTKICTLLQQAQADDDISGNAIRATLLSYLLFAISNLNESAIAGLRNTAESLSDRFPMLDLVHDEFHDKNITHEELSNLIDSIHEYNDAPIVASDQGPHMIETGTEYSDSIATADGNFHSIRDVAKTFVTDVRGLSMRGTEVINDPHEAALYLRNYGNMHFAKMQSALDSPYPYATRGKIDLIDWGCGQGIATMAYLDRFGRDNINMIVLIDPSEIALKRAALHCD